MKCMDDPFMHLQSIVKIDTPHPFTNVVAPLYLDPDFYANDYVLKFVHGKNWCNYIALGLVIMLFYSRIRETL